MACTSTASPSSWLLQLAPFASQHHNSEYNRLKHGHKGAPVPYAPFDPELVSALRVRQQAYADTPRWWPSPPHTSPVIPAAKQRAALATGHAVPHPDLQHQLALALSESIALQPKHHAHLKTSESHPIHISQIIPPESLVAISSHMHPCKYPHPVLFEIHLPDPTPIPGSKVPLPPLPSSRILLSLKRTFKPHDRAPPQTRLPSLPTPYALHPFSPHARPPTAPSPPNKISRLRVSRSTASSKQDTPNHIPFKLGNLLLSSCPGKKIRLSGPVRGRSAVCRDLDLDLRRMKLLGARCVVCCLDDEELEFLIGASWTEYCKMAHQEGLDVLRLPLPEGLAPLSPKAFDDDLDRIIQSYTLQGTSVLVHCRGGVGRAGLFACCWMIKLGLCGWIETNLATDCNSLSEIKNDNDVPSEIFRWDNDTVVRRDTLQMVERVIEVVRRRRSVKAIETLEQVQFLVEYVDYLRACGRVGGDSSNLHLSS